MARAHWVLVAAAALTLAPALLAQEAKPAEDAEGKIPADAVNKDGVLLRLDGVDMLKVVELYSRITGKIVIPSPEARGKVTIINRDRLKTLDATRLIESALELQGWTMIPQGNIIKLVKSREAVKRLLPTGEPGSELALQNVSRMQTFVVPIRYAVEYQLEGSSSIDFARGGTTAFIAGALSNGAGAGTGAVAATGAFAGAITAAPTAPSGASRA